MKPPSIPPGALDPKTDLPSADAIRLPAPDLSAGRPLMQVLAERHSSREFRPDPLPLDVISGLLWAAWGVNREKTGHRTAPSARNWQEMDLYVTVPEGLFLYVPQHHVLERVLPLDLRAATGTQDYVPSAPLQLVLVADLDRMTDVADRDKAFYSVVDAGFISQNIYLYCASEGLATVVRGSVDRRALHHKMRLRPCQQIVLAQSVGLAES